MDAKYIRERITQLRVQKDVSEYKMSYDLGHSRGYINNISSGKTLPSMTEFLAICDYFGITPKQFFDNSLPNPEIAQQALDGINQLNESDQRLVLTMIHRLLQTEK